MLAANIPARAQTIDPLVIPYSKINRDSSSWITTLVPLPDGKILAGGITVQFISSGNRSHTNLVRLNPDGLADDSFNVGFTQFGSRDVVNCTALLPNGQVMVGGYFYEVNRQSRFHLARFEPDGSLDLKFDPIYLEDSVNSIRIQPDGKILICGWFNAYDFPGNAGLCRLNPDGRVDDTFKASANGPVVAMDLQPDGKVLAMGRFTKIGGQSRTNFARLNADGSLDAGFQSARFNCFGQPGFGTPYYGTLLVQPDGKILLGGLFDHVNGLAHTNIARFNTDGSLDDGFTGQADLHNCLGVQTLTLQANGSLLVGHDSLTFNGISCPNLSRLNPDGTLDPGFGRTSVGGAVVYNASLQMDGKILIAGAIASLAGVERHVAGRLNNTEAATQSLVYDGTNVIWWRGGTSPEVCRTIFESSTNGIDWIYVGEGSRIVDGWVKPNLTVTPGTSIRARGFVTGGRANGSSWFVESQYPTLPPTLTMRRAAFDSSSNSIGFEITGTPGATVLIEASEGLEDWACIATNMLGNGPQYFTHPSCTNSVQFYRARLP